MAGFHSSTSLTGIDSSKNASAMGMEHFSHDHPLVSFAEVTNNLCNACYDWIKTGPVYDCKQCIYTMHKVCAELPREMKHHPMHPQHPLTLLAPDPHHQSHMCNACGISTHFMGFVYHCSLCDFNLDLKCASMAHRVELEYHPHPLIPLQHEASFTCSACGSRHEGVSYKCSVCVFWVHQKCASQPSTIMLSGDEHLLTLAHSRLVEYSTFEYYCDMCSQELDMRRCWFYYCAGCRYFVHLKCAMSRRDKENEVEHQVVLDPNTMLFPLENDLVNIVTEFAKKVSLEETKTTTKLDHFGHHHPLALFDEQNNDELCSGSKSKLSLLNEAKNNNKLCEACVQPISALFYCCTECNYFLHKCCAELPTRIQHPCHPEHPLDLLPKSKKDFGIFWCRCCMKPTNGFTYECAECGILDLDVNLDVNCGSLSSSPIKHEAHKHLLIPEFPSASDECNACFNRHRMFIFICVSCDYLLDTRCVLSPKAVKHRYDEHPFILNYSPIKNHPSEYYCEICEEEVNPKGWFYHCGDCDQSIHFDCMNNYLRFSNVRYGASCKLACHPHSLTLVQFKMETFRCNGCGEYLNGYSVPGFECRPCKLKLHFHCTPGEATDYEAAY